MVGKADLYTGFAVGRFGLINLDRLFPGRIIRNVADSDVGHYDHNKRGAR